VEAFKMILFNFNMECLAQNDLTDEEMAKIKEDLFNLMQQHNLSLVNLGVYDLIDESGEQVVVPLVDLPPNADALGSIKHDPAAIMEAMTKALEEAGFTVIDANSEPESDTDYIYPQTSKRLN